jgi:hypothetical protein
MPLLGTFASNSAKAIMPTSSVGAGLYTFTNATFTPGGQTGRTGPSLSQARSGLSGAEVNDWKNDTEFFNTSSGIILWTVPADATYELNIAGAKGGNAGNGSQVGGQGARLKANVQLDKGTILNIVIGQQGRPGNSGRGGGGGGGSFVYSGSVGGTGLIIAAGGGGGSDDNSPGGSNARSDLNPSGQGGSQQTNDGQAGTGSQGNGTGWLTTIGGTGGRDGGRFTGGTAVDNGHGGWGGGGGDGDDGGSGAGFSGGDGSYGAGAGGSYYAGLSISGFTSTYAASVSSYSWIGNNNGDGLLVITKQ